MASRLTRVELRGFKTYAEMEADHAFRPTRLNVLIGPNGAGKSNLIAFFRMLSWALTPPGKLQEYLARQGGASTILCDGPGNTRELTAHVCIETDAGENEYRFRLAYAADDTLISTEESFRFNRSGMPGTAPWRHLDVGKRELQLSIEAERGEQTARVVHALLRKIAVYQFHNTSDTARIRGKWKLDDNRYLKEDGANVAPVLYRLRENEPRHYHRIVQTLRQVLPFFEDFEFAPEYGALLLHWREAYSSEVFGASQAGDGMIRIMGLVTLLLLPRADLPDILILDEPELGLHPYAIEMLGGLIRSLSESVQIVLATQSLPLLDCFEPENIVVVDRHSDGFAVPRIGRYSRLRHLNRDDLSAWLDEYSLSELWEKNVLGGRP